VRGLSRAGRERRFAERPVKTDPLDFTNCRQASAESDADWTRVIARGGPAAGLSSEMPEFSMLNESQIGALVRRLRAFCSDARWPTGNFAFPRALFTTKALPEDEVVIRPMVSHGEFAKMRSRIAAAYEMRLGGRARASRCRCRSNPWKDRLASTRRLATSPWP
jgi:hypothetical protein